MTWKLSAPQKLKAMLVSIKDSQPVIYYQLSDYYLNLFLSEKFSEDQLTCIKLELLKLKRLGESPHENVVTILDTGISKGGNYFCIGKESIGEPDLENLLQIQQRSIFTIQETQHVVEQLSNARDHCHRMKVIHGSIETGNIKRNSSTGMYVVVNFGSVIIPEQQAGKLLY